MTIFITITGHNEISFDTYYGASLEAAAILVCKNYGWEKTTTFKDGCIQVGDEHLVFRDFEKDKFWTYLICNICESEGGLLWGYGDTEAEALDHMG